MAMLDSVWLDIKYAVRILRRKPSFTVTALLVLAFGIGINSATFAILNGIALRALPVKDSEQLVRIERFHVGYPPDECCIPYPDYAYYRDNNSAFSSVIAFWGPGPFTMNGTQETGGGKNAAELAYISLVSGDYFSTLGGAAMIGRTLTTEDDRAGTSPVGVLSYSFWNRRFGSDPSVVGKILTIQNQQIAIVGVANRTFVGVTPQTPDVWVPLSAQPRILPLTNMEDRASGWLRLIGRLKPGVDVTQAQSGMSVLAGLLASDFPETNEHIGVHLAPASSFGNLGGMLRVVFVLVLGGVMMVLLLTCANVAVLVLARASSRHLEIAVRLAVGAGRPRLIRQLLTENLILWLVGGVAGLALAFWGLKLLVWAGLSAMSKDMGVIDIAVNLEPDMRVCVYTFAISAATGLLFGLAPALQFTQTDLTPALKKDGSFFAGNSGRKRSFSFREWMIVVQLAVCLVLLITDGLMLRGLQRAQSIDPGYEYKKVLIAEPNFLMLGYDPAKTMALNDDLRDRIAGLPGVESVAFSTRTSGGRWTRVQTSDSSEAATTLGSNYTMVSSNYFETMNIPIISGRAFTDAEVRSHAPVCIVSQATAQRLWPGKVGLGGKVQFGKPRLPGKHFEPEPYSAESEVVGIARDVRSVRLHEVDSALLYLPLEATNETQIWLMVRATGDMNPLTTAIGNQIENVERGAFPRVYTLTSQLEQQMLPTRALSMVGTLLGVLGLLLASIGLYGVVMFSVTARTREIGIRMALGATPGHVIRLVLSRVGTLVAVGACFGLVGAALLSGFLVSLIYGVDRVDPVTFLAATVLMGGVALGAAVIPARRATRIDPISALRQE
jgi:macrolide transport system ATP-binding/permease protein